VSLLPQQHLLALLTLPAAAAVPASAAHALAAALSLLLLAAAAAGTAAATPFVQRLLALLEMQNLGCCLASAKLICGGRLGVLSHVRRVVDA
jgi:hypothetical protein